MKHWMILPTTLAAGILGAAAHAGFAGDGGALHGHMARWLHGHVTSQIDENPGAHVGAHLDAFAARLELTEPQRKQVAGAVRTALPDLERSALALGAAHTEQIELLHAPVVDEVAVRAAATRIGAAEGDLAVGAARLLRDVHALLTPEQRDRAAAWHRPGWRAMLSDHVRGASQGLRAWADRQ